MSARLQVLLEDSDIADIRRVARIQGTSVSEWVRQVLQRECRKALDTDPRPRLAALRVALSHAFPTAAIEKMQGDITRGYTSE